MTKEETIDLLINDYKNEGQSALGNYCNRTNCDECAFSGCSNDIVNMLIDRIIKAEEAPKAKTNLEHYMCRNGVHITKEHDVEVWEFRFKKGTEKQFFDANIKSVLDWLLSPYEEPKPRYKLSKFEYDLLKSCYNDLHGIKDSWMLDNMHDKGYFKDIPTDVPIKEILDNCEVIEE